MMLKIVTSSCLLLCMTVCPVLSDKGYFWHITDHHFDPTYWSEMRSCNDKVPVPGIYGDYWCDSPWRLVNDSIVAMTQVKKDVDFILWTGDNVAHIDNKFLNTSLNLAIITKITSTLKAAFPGIKVYATMGNHDWYPADQFQVYAAFLYNATAELWKDWINETEQVNSFRNGGFYTVTIRPGLKLVGVNTVLYYTPNHVTANMTDPAGQFDWLEKTLQKARQGGEKVLLTGHVPPGIKVPGKVLWFYPTFNTRFLDIVRTFADVITGMYFGHDHADELRLISRPGGSPGVPMFLAPSVTPWRYKSGSESDYPHNPAVRLFTYDRNSGLALDYVQYYMDLVASNNKNQSTWTVAYKASEAYHASDLSSTSIDNVVKKMRTDHTYLDKYIRYNSVLANGEKVVNSCKDHCRADFICAFTNLDWHTFNTCVTAQVGSVTRLFASSLLIFTMVVISSMTFV